MLFSLSLVCPVCGGRQEQEQDVNMMDRHGVFAVVM